MELRQCILKELNIKGELKAAEIIKATGFSRAYINRFFRELINEGKIILLGKANKAVYVKANTESVLRAKKKILGVKKFLKNQNLSEDTVLDAIKRESGIFLGIKDNLKKILDYGFTEMLNNAIEHSKSPVIGIVMKKNPDSVTFEVWDKGIGVFNNIARKKALKSQMEAILELLKGKQTTMPRQHSGEGIFFTSKIADTFVIESYGKKLLFNNFLDDIFIQDIKNFHGTKINFSVGLKSKKHLEKVFKTYAGNGYEFSKTRVAVRLYKMDSVYVSRSQARRILVGLDKFKTVILDFKLIKTVGQAFADEVFRVWKHYHPGISIVPANFNENIDFMIKRAIGKRT